MGARGADRNGCNSLSHLDKLPPADRPRAGDPSRLHSSVRNIGSLRVFSLAHGRYLRGRNRARPPALRNKIDIKDIGRRRQEVSTSLSRRPKESSSRV